MTSETNLTEEFFRVFGIEPEWKDVRSQNTTIYTDEQAKEIRKTNRNIQLCYPQISSDRLLEMICLHSTWCEPRLCATNIEAIKRQVLRDLIFEDCEKLKQQVQQLFKEQ